MCHVKYAVTIPVVNTMEYLLVMGKQSFPFCYTRLDENTLFTYLAVNCFFEMYVSLTSVVE